MESKRSTNERDYYFERIGEDFDRWISDYDTDRRGNLIRRHLGTKALGKTCLEIGCGTGKISEMILPLVGTLTVSDISEKLAQQTGERLKVASSCQDACALSFSDSTFDVIVSSECIEHCPDPAKALQEMARVLKPGGIMVVTTPNKVWYPLIWAAVTTKLRNFKGRENWLFPLSAASLLKKCEMENVALDGCHLFPWQLPFAKKVLPLFDKAGKWLYPIMINFCITARKPQIGHAK